MVPVLSGANPARKAKIYASLGLLSIFYPRDNKVLVRSSSDQDQLGETNVSEGGLEPPCPIRALAPQASASANSATRT
jgi:hypothetical protein